MGVPLIEVADALVDEINSWRANIGLYAEAKRNYGDADDDVTALSDLQLDVIPAAAFEDPDSVSFWEYSCSFDVLLRKRIGTDSQVPTTGEINQKEIDDLIGLTHALWERLIPSQNADNDHTGRLTTESGWSAAFDSQASRVVYYYNRKHLKRRQYTGYVRIVYTISKEPASAQA